MRLDEYQEEAHKTAVYPPSLALEYLALGLCGEAGELANKVKKLIRGDTNCKELEEGCQAELGDILWYLAELANELGVSLELVAQENLKKLRARQVYGTLKGSGDIR